MRPAEGVLIAANLLASMVLVIPLPGAARWPRRAAPLVLLVAGAQLLAEGPRWQMVPAYTIGGVILLVWLIQNAKQEGRPGGPRRANRRAAPSHSPVVVDVGTTWSSRRPAQRQIATTDTASSAASPRPTTRRPRSPSSRRPSQPPRGSPWRGRRDHDRRHRRGDKQAPGDHRQVRRPERRDRSKSEDPASSTVKRDVADVRARSTLSTEQPIYPGRASGWLVVGALEPSSAREDPAAFSRPSRIRSRLYSNSST